MNGLKHILIAVALLLAVAPCMHAEDHGKHLHDSEARTEICAAHPCSCHACDPAPGCTDVLDIQLQLDFTATPSALSVSTFHLFTLAQRKPFITHIPLSVAGVLASLQTVQLLI